eukprot:gene12984-biopygen3069
MSARDVAFGIAAVAQALCHTLPADTPVIALGIPPRTDCRLEGIANPNACYLLLLTTTYYYYLLLLTTTYYY